MVVRPSATGDFRTPQARPGLGTRLLVVCAILGILVVAPVVASWWVLSEAHEAQDESSRVAAQLALTHDLESAAVDVQSTVDTFVVVGTPVLVSQSQTQLATLDSTVANMESAIADDPRATKLRDALRLVREFAAARAALLAIAQRNRAQARPQLGASSLIVGVRAALGDCITTLEGRAVVLAATADREVHRSRALLTATVLAVPLAVILVFLYVRSVIARPIRKVSEAARMIAAGDHSVRVGNIGRGEIGDMARAFDTMVDEIETATAEIRAQNLQIRREKEQSDRERAVTEAVLQATPTAIQLVDESSGQVLVANRSVRHLPPLVFCPSTRASSADEISDVYVDPDSGRTFRRYVAPFSLDDGHVGSLIVVRETTAELAGEKAKADLLTTVSHELRTPLAAVVGYSELLARRDLDAETRSAYARMILEQALHLESLVTTLLDLRMIEEGGLELAAEEFDLVELLREKRELHTGQSDRHFLSLMGAPGPIVVRADRERIGQALANLVSNAIKYSPAGGVIRLAAELRDGRARVSVQDSGVGIPEDDRRRVFERFVRLDHVTGVGGSGLGLAIVDEVVRLHGGEVGVASEPGRGSTFWFDLPVERVVARSLEPASHDPGDTV